jgi:large subunit ribosomal protein L31
MKKNIHPTYYNAKITCVSCNTTYEVGSTLETMSIEVCGNCHPFYTGKYRVLDSTGRVEKFNKKYANFLNVPKASKNTEPASVDESSTQS